MFAISFHKTIKTYLCDIPSSVRKIDEVKEETKLCLYILELFAASNRKWNERNFGLKNRKDGI